MTINEDGEVIRVGRRQGSFYYWDEIEFKEEVPIISYIIISTVMGEKGTQTLWRSGGLLATIVEGIAQYYMKNPGMREAVEGMCQLLTVAQGGKRT